MIDDDIVQKVWEKGIIADGFDSSQVRKDYAGAYILRTHYKNRNSDYGWEIDHVYPLSRGGGDQMINLRPMQWENNLKKSDSYPTYETAVIAEGNSNVKRNGVFTVNSDLQEKLKKLYQS